MSKLPEVNVFDFPTILIPPILPREPTVRQAGEDIEDRRKMAALRELAGRFRSPLTVLAEMADGDLAKAAAALSVNSASPELLPGWRATFQACRELLASLQDRIGQLVPGRGGKPQAPEYRAPPRRIDRAAKSHAGGQV